MVAQYTVCLGAALFWAVLPVDAADARSGPFDLLGRVAQVKVKPMGQWGGVNSAVAISGDFAYIGAGTRLLILDVTDSSAPVKLGKTKELPAKISAVAVKGKMVYVTCNDDFNRPIKALHIIDVSNPVAPLHVGSCAIGMACGILSPYPCSEDSGTISNPTNVAISRDYAWVIACHEGLQVINVSDPTAPCWVGGIDMDGCAHAVAVSGDYAYVASGSAGVQVIDISRPASPTWVAEHYAGNAWGVSVQGKYLYVAGGNAGLFIFNISEPHSPEMVAHYPDPDGWSFDLTVSGDYAYIAGSHLRIFDVSHAEQPELIAQSEYMSEFVDVCVSAGRAYLPSPGDGLHIFDVSNDGIPDLPQLGHYILSSEIKQVVVTKDTAFITNWARGLEAIKTDVFDPTWVGGVDIGGWAQALDVSGGYAYLTDLLGAMFVIDINDPTEPQFVSVTPVDEPYGITVEWPYAYIAAGLYGLEIYDIRDAESPIYVGRSDTTRRARDVKVVGCYAYVAVESDGLLVFDVSNPNSPTLCGEFETTGPAYGVDVSGKIAYVATGESDDKTGLLQIINIEDPNEPWLVGQHETGGRTAAVKVAGDYAYVASCFIADPQQGVDLDSYTGLRIFDVTDPAEPILVGGYATPVSATGLDLAGKHVYLSDGNGELRVLRIERGRVKPYVSRVKPYVN